MPGRRSLVAWVVIVVLVAAGYLVFRGGRVGFVRLEPNDAAADNPAQKTLPHAPGAEDVQQKLGSIQHPDMEPVATPPPKELGAGERRLVHGSVRYSRSRAPIENVRVTVKTEVNGKHGVEPWSTADVTKDDGAFLLSLPVDVFPQETECTVLAEQVSTFGERSSKQLLTSKQQVADGMELFIAPKKSLHGRIEFVPERPKGKLELALYSGETQREGRLRAQMTLASWAHQPIASDGSFEIPLEDEKLHEDVHLTILGLNLFVASAESTYTALTSEPGAAIVIRVAKQVVRLLDPSGAPLDSGTVEVEYAEGTIGGGVGPRGEVTLLLGSGPWSLRASAREFESQAKLVHIEPRRVMPALEFHLAPAVHGESVEGQVVSEDGAPLSNANVHVDDLRLVSDERGFFSFSANGEGPWHIGASDKSHTAIDSLVWKRGMPAPRLVLHAEGVLTISVKGARKNELSEHQIVVVDDRRGGDTWVEVAAASIGLLPGEYTIAMRTCRPEKFACAHALVVPGDEVEIKLVLEPAARFSGQVRRGRGDLEGLDVVLDAPDWPVALRERWGKTFTGNEGRFEIFAGTRKTPNVRIFEDGKELGRFELKAGAINELQLP